MNYVHKSLEAQPDLSGVVVEVHGILATIALPEGTRLRARPPRARETPLIGDRVTLEREGSDWRIAQTAPRERTMARLGVPPQPLATHVDRLVVVMAVEPGPRPAFLDRVWVAMDDALIAAQGVSVHVVLNKCDLPGVAAARAALADHVALGVTLWETSAKTGAGVSALAALLAEGGLSLILGHSGVGKSSLVNRIIPSAALRTGDVNAMTAKGRHTTTVSTCHLLGAGLVVDTPGVRALPLDGLALEAVAARFPSFAAPSEVCHFAQCLHEGEPGCQVDEDPGIPEARRQRYLSLLADLRAEAETPTRRPPSRRRS